MNQTSERMQGHHRQADRLMLGVLAALALMAFALSGMHGTLTWAVAVGLPTALIPAGFILMLPGTRLTRCIVSAALMVFSALHIHQAGGMTEVHFEIFVLLAFLLCYRDWTTILTGAAVIAVHHLSLLTTRVDALGAAAASMHAQASQLFSVVEVFRLEPHAAQPPAACAAPG